MKDRKEKGKKRGKDNTKDPLKKSYGNLLL